MVCSPDKDRGRLPIHPDLEAEQAYVDYAYECLDAARRRAASLGSMVEVGRGGTEQARFERDVIWDTIVGRLRDLELGDASLVFGRINRAPVDGQPMGDTFYIGRFAVADEGQEPIVVDWRGPVAEPFYRATGRAPMGLDRRRHFATRGHQVLGIEDELFGDAALRFGALPDGASPNGNGIGDIRGEQTLIASLEEARTGRLTDI